MADDNKTSAFVEYRQPSYAVLKNAFYWVYDGYKNAKFTSIEACKDVLRKNRVVEFELMHLKKSASTVAILAALDRLGLRPALYEELIAFAAKYPDLQKRFPIVALGSVCMNSGDPGSPYISWRDSERYLGFYWYGFEWSGGYRFLAVRK